MIKTQFSNLPPEVISIIGSKLPIKELRSFKEVCLSNRHFYDNLYHIINNDISNRDVLKIHLRGDSKSEKFLADYDFLIKSNIKISLKLPTKQSKIENLKPKLVEMINLCHARISQIKINFDNPVHLLEHVLLKCKQMEKILIMSNWNIAPQMIQNLVNNNCASLKNLSLFYMTFTVNFQFNPMPKLKEVKLNDCRGDITVQSLLSRSPDVTTLSLCNMYIDAASATNFRNLQEVELRWCMGAMSTMLNHCAGSLTSLKLKSIDIDSAITNRMVNLKYLKLDMCKGELSSLVTEGADSICCLELFSIDMNTWVNRPLKNLQRAEVDSRKIDVSDTSLLRCKGKLEDLKLLWPKNSLKRTHSDREKYKERMYKSFFHFEWHED